MTERIICNDNGGELREEIVRKEGEGMSMLTEQTERLRKTADKLRSVHVDDRDVGTLFAVMGELREAADTIDSLRDRLHSLQQKVEDLEGMLRELPPEGKCAMLLVKQVGGEYIWGCELYDFASYCLVDSEADTYTGMTLNDPFGRADFADKLTMAKELRRMAASLEAQGDVLGVMDAARESYDAGFSNGVKACLQQLDGLIHKGADIDEIQGWIDRQWEEEA